MQYHELLAKFIKELREEKGTSLNSFSYLNGIEPSTMSRIENAKLEIKVSMLLKIAKGFELKPSELLKIFEDKLTEDFIFTDEKVNTG